MNEKRKGNLAALIIVFVTTIGVATMAWSVTSAMSDQRALIDEQSDLIDEQVDLVAELRQELRDPGSFLDDGEVPLRVDVFRAIPEIEERLEAIEEHWSEYILKDGVDADQP